MPKFKRGNPLANSGKRMIVVENCYSCPFAQEKYSTFGSSFGFVCSQNGRSYLFDDNLIHFSTLEDCPLDKFKEDE